MSSAASSLGPDARVTVLGVDGCPGGWLGALVDVAVVGRNGGQAVAVRWHLLPDGAAILAAGEGCAAIAVDMPMGLPDAGPRRCDVLARRHLGPRRSSVFPAPVRAVLDAQTYADACELSRVASGRALPRQVWHLLPRIADLDRLISPVEQDRLVEAHPELSFARMAGLLPAKKSPAGRDLRLAALSAWLPAVADVVAGAPRPARAEDAADALACAWSAWRLAAGRAVVVPEQPERDARGLRMQIVS